MAGGHIGFKAFGCGYDQVAEVAAGDVLGGCLLGLQDETLVGVRRRLERGFFV